MSIYRPEDFVKDPSEARFVCEVLAEKAADGVYPYKRAYQALRSLDPNELFDLYSTLNDDGNDAFRAAFGPYYHSAAGEPVDGPLFQEASHG